jgi:hypothetical protein
VKQYRFFLGGHDLEMVTIRELIEARLGKDAAVDKRLSWGAALSSYGSEIAAIYAAGLVPVAVELFDDLPADWPPRSSLIDIDHHGARHMEASALRQVFDLLQLPEKEWSRDFALVAANDTGHVRKMRAMGASVAEMIDIRRRDRMAQGITADEDAAGRAALAHAEISANGNLLIIALPHSRSATVTDPLALEAELGHLPKQVIVLGTTTTMFFGLRTIIDRLRNEFPSGFSGGDGETGFFGLPSPETGAIQRLRQFIEKEVTRA